MSNNSDRTQLTVLSNPTFLNDDQEPPPPPYSSVYLIDPSSGIPTNNNTSTCSFEMNNRVYSQQPVSYDELFQSSNSNVPFFSNLVQNINEIRARNNHPPLCEPGELRAKCLIDGLNKQFPRTYLKKHMQTVLLASILLIMLQMYLIEYRVMYSTLASGVWAGSFNLLTFVMGMIMIKCAKEWLLIVSIMLHVACIMFSLGGFIIINAIILTRPCSDSCSINNSGKITMIIVMLILGVISMIAFSVYLVKLIRVFNSVQSKLMEFSH